MEPDLNIISRLAEFRGTGISPIDDKNAISDVSELKNSAEK